ncbi:MAG: DUF5654 family protein [Candidatus Paceibacterota bacterium]|jgi:uncharacterized membrane protein YdbT with pleckstrin-like domain
MSNESKKELLKEVKEKAKEDARKASRTFLEKTGIYVMAGLGLVVGLAWNDAIQALVKELVPIGTGTVVLKFIYAVIITGVLVLISMRMEKNSS